MTVVQAIDLIAISPYVRSGRAYVLGTTVTVSDVAIARLYHDKDPDGIADWYGLSLSQVYAALAYYYEHKDEIDQEIRQQISRAEMLKERRVGSPDAEHPERSGGVHPECSAAQSKDPPRSRRMRSGAHKAASFDCARRTSAVLRSGCWRKGGSQKAQSVPVHSIDIALVRMRELQ